VPVLEGSMNVCVLVNLESVGCVLHQLSSASGSTGGGGDVTVCACIWCESPAWVMLGAAPCLWPSV